MKNFFRDVKDSFYNPTFYSNLASRKVSNAILFLLAVTAISIFVLTINIVVQVIPEIKKINPTEFVENVYPEGLEIKIKDGIASSNVEEPYVISNKDIDSHDTSEENLITIYTQKEDISLNEIESLNSLVVLTQTDLVAEKSDGELRIFSLEGVKDFTINKENVSNILNKLLKWLPLFLVLVVVFGWALVTTFSFAATLVILFLLALIPFFVAKLKKQALSYKQSYITALFMMAPVIILETFLTIIFAATLPFWATLLILVLLAWLNIRKVSVLI
ncbi:MAG TPA: DUF1189 family protein [Candidatus Nanoarchaeia archaeon]|nr:DUF1189 family protein [Candidatus Nanoarchaeia archaeon]